MKRFIIAALATAAVVGCQKNELVSIPESSHISFSAAISSSNTKSTDQDRWEGDGSELIGIYLESSYKNLYNIQYQVTDPDNGTLKPYDSDDFIETPTSGKAKFYAYYPYRSYMTDGEVNGDITIPRDVFQSDVSNQITSLTAIDFMIAYKEYEDISTLSDDIELEFYHQLSKVTLEVTPKGNITDLTGLKVYISGASNRADLSLTGGFPDFSNYFADESNYAPIEFNTYSKVESNGVCSSMTFVAILHPEYLDFAELIFELGDDRYTTQIGGNFEAVQGTNHKFEVELGVDTPTSVTVTANGIIPWYSGDSNDFQSSLELIGDGSESNPFYVYDAEDLAKVGSCVDDAIYYKDGIGNKGSWTMDAHYKLINNINLGGEDEWTPLASDSNAQFTGSFDGNGKVISGLKITADLSAGTTTEYKGLFIYVGEEGEVKDLGLIGCNIAGSTVSTQGIGGIVLCNSGTVSNCYVSGNLTVSDRAIGGYIGAVVGINEGEVVDCYNLASVNGVFQTGGIVGYNFGGSITRCYNSAKITGFDMTGGVVARSHGTINSCYNSGSVTGDFKVGGVVGTLELDSNITGVTNYIISSYNVGDITNSANNHAALVGTAGVCGYACENAHIIGCYSAGTISATQNIAGIVGYSDAAYIEGCLSYAALEGYTDATTTGAIIGIANSGGINAKTNYYIVESAGSFVFGIGGTSGDTSGKCQAITMSELLEDGSLLTGYLNSVVDSYNSTATIDASSWVYDSMSSIYPTLDFNATATE